MGWIERKCSTRLTEAGPSAPPSRDGHRGGYHWARIRATRWFHRILRDYPTGKSTDKPAWPLSHVQSSLKKYSGFPKPQITGIIHASRPTEGRFAIVTDVGTGCGGRGCAFDEWC